MPDDDKAGEKQAKRLKELEEKFAEMEADRDKWKELSRKNEDRAKANAEASDELKKLRESKQTDEEKLAAKIAEIEQRANESDLRALRAEVAQAKGLNAQQAKRLQGSTKDELESDADDLLESFPAAGTGDGEDGKGGKKPPTDRPRERLRSGGGSEQEPDDDDGLSPRELAEKIPRL